MWQPPPMPQPASAPWGLSISGADFKKLEAGLEPRDHDDKWRYKATHDGRSGLVTIHIVRVGMQHELYSIAIKTGDGSDGNGSASHAIETINWSQDQGGNPISEALAKKHVVILSRCNLECDFEAAPSYGSEGFFGEPADCLHESNNRTNSTDGVNVTV